MNMQGIPKFKTAIVGGGASGLVLACSLSPKTGGIALFERGERVGRKLSATGNGQGNITNLATEKTPYFSSDRAGAERAERIIREYPHGSLCDFFEGMGVLLFFDDRGRGYPAGRQASALTDALRFQTEKRGVRVFTTTQIARIEKRNEGFLLASVNGERFEAEQVVLCTGGKAAKNFGTDGSAYALAQELGHTVTPLYPSLVQLKTDTASIRALKGIRVFDAGVTAVWSENGVRKRYSLRGDILFTDYGVSGDAIFRLSAFFADKAEGAELLIDFLPDFTEERVYAALQSKRAAFPDQPSGEWLCGIVNNQVGRAVMKTLASPEPLAAVRRVKAFPLAVRGTLGFDYAQVTKGGIPMRETDEHLQSRFIKGLYFAGETLDIDGECGGFNLQWAYSSARKVAAALDGKSDKRRG